MWQTQDYEYRPNEDIIDRMRRRKQKSIFTYLLVAANVVLFLIVNACGGTESANMIRWGAMYPPLVSSGQWYRLISCMFLHFDLRHLFFNMILLVFLGDYMERFLGKIRFLILYFGGGLLASLASYCHDVLTGKSLISAGASGAVFAAMGGLLGLLLMNRGRMEDLDLRRVLVSAVLSLLVGFQSSGVDNFAHLGGLIGGFLLSILLYFTIRKNKHHG